MTGYRCIVVDPPWPQHGAGALCGRMGFGDATGASKPLPYNTMSVPEIGELPVADLAHTDGAICWLWTTNGFLPQAWAVLAAWGFRYTHTLVWSKAIMGGGIGRQVGISTEFVLRAVLGRPAVDRRIRGTSFTWKRQYDERGKPLHSAKPAGFFELVEAHAPGPYVEVFARRARMGWDAWGDQAPDPIAWAAS